MIKVEVSGFLDLINLKDTQGNILNDEQIKEVKNKLSSYEYIITMTNNSIIAVENPKEPLFTFDIGVTNDLNCFYDVPEYCNHCSEPYSEPTVIMVEGVGKHLHEVEVCPNCEEEI